MLPPGGKPPQSPSPVSSFQHTSVLSSSIASFQTTPGVESPVFLQGLLLTPTDEASPNVSVRQSPPAITLNSELQIAEDMKSKYPAEQGERW